MLTNGLLVQWRINNAQGEFSFPIAFSDTNYAIAIALNDTSYSDKTRGLAYNLKTKTKQVITLQCNMSNGSGYSKNDNLSMSIIAIGY